MSNATGLGNLGIIHDLRDRAEIARRISRELSDDEAAKRLQEHAHDLEQQAKALEDRLLRRN